MPERAAGGAKRLISNTRALNRNPELVRAAKRARERLLGDDELADQLATARRRPADLAARELASYRREQPGVLGELGLTALQAWQSFSEHRGRGRGEIDVAILFTDLAGFLQLGAARRRRTGDRAAAESRRRR